MLGWRDGMSLRLGKHGHQLYMKPAILLITTVSQPIVQERCYDSSTSAYPVLINCRIPAVVHNKHALQVPGVRWIVDGGNSLGTTWGLQPRGQAYGRMGASSCAWSSCIRRDCPPCPWAFLSRSLYQSEGWKRRLLRINVRGLFLSVFHPTSPWRGISGSGASVLRYTGP